MNRLITRILMPVLLVLPITTTAGIYPPAPGVEIPQAYFDRIEQNRDVFRFQNAWLKKVDDIRDHRQKYIHERGFFHRDLVSAEQKPQLAVTGTLSVPVFMVKFANTGADPYATSVLSQKLFTGPFSPRTLTQYYTEISYGDITMTGTVYGWHQLPQNDTYYEGGTGCNGLCSTAQIGALITSTLGANDASVDFGQFDNDGPDGIPNSGDDDGFVDFVAFVHAEAGGECGGDNIWSHRWVLSGWTGSAYTTNDPSANGGNIRVEDYVIQPAFNCGGVTVIDIGVFCHEFGHALSLPDLYDTNGGSQGIGHWGLMGSGSWNTPTNPAHMSSWSKTQMGWSNVIRASGKKTTYTVPAVENNRTVYRLDVMNARWRRMSTCAIAGTFSMRCGLRASEGTGRNWAGGDGYGDMWRERMYRDYSYDGTTPVTLAYDYGFDSEPAYDYTYVRIDVGGTVSTVASYTGVGGGSANIDLTPYLSGSGVSTYRLSFEFESDVAWSDRDGNHLSNCGPFVVDNVAVVGGGENYFTNFELYEDGWCYDASDVDEYFLVTNRQPIGSDVNVHGGGGLNIWHINQNVTRTGQSGNNGGIGNSQPRGVAVEQADNLFQLENNANRGDGGDPFPGNRFNTTFDNNSRPDSRGSNGLLNNVCVINISSNPANGGNMTADMSGGFGPPTYASHNPVNSPPGTIVQVSISGGLMACGATAELQQGATVISSRNEMWSGNDLLDVEFDLTGAPLGTYDLVVYNPGGACTVVSNAFVVDAVVPTALSAFRIHETSDGIAINWETADDSDIIGWRVYRAEAEGMFASVSGNLLPAEARQFVDSEIEHGVAYTYRLSWITADGEAMAAERSVTTRALQTALAQNYPNPFNPGTTIPFELAKQTRTTLRIYNIRGQVVRTLVDGVLESKRYEIAWDGRNDAGAGVTSGVYFYRLVAGSFQDVRKMVVTK